MQEFTIWKNRQEKRIIKSDNVFFAMRKAKRLGYDRLRTIEGSVFILWGNDKDWTFTGNCADCPENEPDYEPLPNR